MRERILVRVECAAAADTLPDRFIDEFADALGQLRCCRRRTTRCRPSASLTAVRLGILANGVPSRTGGDDHAELIDQEREAVSGSAQQGDSKEKAARISNAAAARGKSAVGRKGGKSGSYADWTVPQLKKRAKELGMSGYSGLTKGKLIAKLRNH